MDDDRELRREMIDAGAEGYEIERRIGEGWTMQQLYDEMKEQGFFDEEES